MKFRKKPVVIEAMELTKESIKTCYEFIGMNCDLSAATDGTFINIATLEGTMQARMGDWIINGVNGEFYPCKPEIFWKTYEYVDWLINRIKTDLQLASDVLAYFKKRREELK